ncbi:MAG: KamA family radical SAM protein [Thermoplasmatota archaeon]
MSEAASSATTRKISLTDGYLNELGGDPREIGRVKRKYPMKVTPYYLNLIGEKGDPIWKQCIPDMDELHDNLNEEDPLKEEEHTPVPYLVHKYPDRVLLLTSSKCAMYCRFCTRKRKVGRIQQIPMVDIMKAIDYINANPVIRDVIVSGGDPLMRTDSEIEMILRRLREIPHVEIIRIGTRMPCVNPGRITPHLARIIAKYHPVYVNIHFNHPREVTQESEKACAILANAGIPLGSQTVLLKGVNDDPDTMKELMLKLLSIRVKPYYIYQCDLVKGVEHFRTPVEDGIRIMKSIQGFTSGLGVPHFVIDGPGGKVPVSPEYVKEITPDEVIVTNYLDQLFSYPGVGTRGNHLGNKRVRKVGLAFNLRKDPEKGEREDRYAEYDDLETIDAIRKALEKMGYDVILLEADQGFLEKLVKANVDFVFNIAEGIQGESRESHIPAILEMMNVPYSGSGVLTQAITLNKSRKKEILNYYKIPTPRFQVFRSTNQKLNSDLRFPLIVKPDAEGSSVGITDSSLVNDPDSLKREVSKVIRIYKQNALVEEYIDGREFTVGLIGNGRPKILPIIEVDFRHLPEQLNKFDSYEAKWVYDNPENPVDPLICPADLKPSLKNRIVKIARDTFSVLGCTDLARIDLRLDDQGIPYVLDVNALPGLMPKKESNSRFTRACFADGMDYDTMIRSIMESALKRYNLKMG